MTAATYFDARHAVMSETIGTDGCWSICYRDQVALLESVIRPGMTVLDIGCGPKLPYRADRAYVIGLDPSQSSLDVNTDVDERICGSATDIPLPDASVDLVVAFYAVHHLTGETLFDHDAMRIRAFAEMDRVLRPDGEILVFDMAPWTLAATAQDFLWPMAKSWLGDRLDAFFWPADVYRAVLPHRVCRVQTFGGSPLTLFPPILSQPHLQIPRFAYPLTPTAFRWHKES